MGGDGGVFAVNRKFFAACRNTSKDGQRDASESEERQIRLSQRCVKSRTCAVSGEELQEPVVACRLGYLYSKEKLLAALLDRKNLPGDFSHIKKLKHVKQLVLTPNSEISGDGKEGEEDACRYMCPVTQLPFNGLYNFVVIWSTGAVLSDKALREIGEQGLQAEYGPFTSEDVVGLLPGEEELRLRRASVQAEAEVAGRQRKDKKRARGGVSAPTYSGSTAASSQEQPLKKQVPGTLPPSSAAGGEGGSKQPLGGSAGIACAARSSVTAAKGKSEVLSGLFHNGKTGEQAKSGNDLFFSVAGIRYTL